MPRLNLKPMAAIIAATLVYPAAAVAQDTPERVEEVIVEGVRSSEVNAREMERKKNIFSSIISQDDAGNFADQNVAEALQRLPGVTITKSDGQGEFVNIRGMGAGFVGVSLNNSELSSTSGDGRAVGLNTIPADLMGSIEVFKSLTPDMDLNSIAGKVNVNSVTAFSRGEDSLRLTVQGSMHEQRGEFSPKATLIGTKLLADDTIGIALSVSHEERGTEVNQIHNSAGLRYIRVAQPGIGPSASYAGNGYGSTDYIRNYFENYSNDYALGADPYIDQPRMLTPYDFEVRQDESIRTRTAATLDLGWRPTDSSEYFLRVAHTDYTDEELTLREYFRFGGGDNRYVAYVNPEFDVDEEGFPYDNVFAVGNADLQQRVYLQEANDVSTTYTLGGENVFANTWILDYEYHNSSSERTNPNDRRVQFRIRSLPMLGQLDQENIIARVLGASQLNNLAEQSDTNFPSSGVPGTGGYNAFPGYERGERHQGAFAYDNIYLEDGLRTDDLTQVQVNLQKDFSGGVLNYIKTGVQMKERERFRDRARWDVNPVDYPFACEGDEACLEWANTGILRGGFETYTPRNPRFDHDFITTEDAEMLLATTRKIPLNLDPTRSGSASKSENYTVYEDSSAAYLMAEFQISDSATLIAGARYVETDYGSTGYLTLRHDRYQEEEGFPRDIAIRLTDPGSGSFVTNEYDGVYPGLHLRWDATDKWLVRSALWTSFTRPDFDEANARASFSDRVILCRDEPLNAGTSNERDRCSDNLQDDLGSPASSGGGAVPDYVTYLSEELSLSPGGNVLRLGNTDLTAMEAINFDASASWYGDNGHFFEAAIFYKDISDFIADVRGLSLGRDELPESVNQAIERIDSSDGGAPDPDDYTVNVFKIGDDFVFHNVETTINGDSAQVYGVELSYSKFFDSGFFVNTNLTLLDSKANAGETVRADETPLPNQADVTSNLTLGWENEDFSARLIGNYRSKVLKQIGTCSQADINRDIEWAHLNDASNPDALPGATGSGIVYAEYCQSWSDVFHDAIFGLDFKATYNWGDSVKFYADVLNLTEDVDVFYYRGNSHSKGPVLYESEGLGRSYQLGVNIRF